MPVKKRRRPVELAISVKLHVDLKTRDEWLADEFLWGSYEASLTGLFRKRRYLENDGRQALLRILRSDQPLSTTLRKRLAELFDPASKVAERVGLFSNLDAKNTDPQIDRSQITLTGKSRM
jgi:hypothetical protein